MKKVLIPVIAGVTMASMAIAQQQATPKLDKHPEVRVQKIEMFCGPSSYLGVYPADVTEENSKSLGMAETYGALLNDVVQESPASAAGLQKNDVVISWNGTRVESAAQLRRMVIETPEGRSVRIGYVRGGTRGEVDAKIGKRPGPDMSMGMGIPMPPQGTFDFKMPEEAMGMAQNLARVIVRGDDFRTGMTLQSMTPQLGKYFGLGDREGALLGAVKEGSSAATAGLQAGDVVVAIDGQKVGSPMDAHKIIGSKKEGSVEVTVIRDKKEQTFTVKLEGKPFDFNFQGMEGLENMRGPMEFFQSLPHDDGEGIEQEIVIPDDGPEPDLSQLNSTGQGGNARIETRIRVAPAQKAEIRKDAPASGL